MLPILEGLAYIDEAWARERLRVAHRSVRAGTEQRFGEAKGTEPTRSQAFVVSFFGGDGKSGSLIARLYAEENRINRSTNVFAADRLEPRLRRLEGIQKIIFVDDFVGTGSGLEGELEAFAAEQGEWFRSLQLEGHIVVLVAFERGVERIRRYLSDLNYRWTSRSCGSYRMTETAAFGPSSRVYPNTDDRERARSLAEEIGRRLEPRTPLGFGDLQALVVFDWACPNNTLPILRRSKENNWSALFERAL